MPSLRPPGIATPLSDTIAVAVVVLFAVLPFPDEIFRASGLLLGVALLPAMVMPFRRRWPVAALGVGLACNVALAFAGVLAPSTHIAIAIAAYAVADRKRRVVGMAYVAGAAATVFVVNAIPLHGELFDSRALQFVLFVVLAGALGDASGSRRQYITAVTERAERAERDRDHEARRRVAEERVRIARDLHDLVAHQISVISLSAGVASSSLAARPERAQEALTAIRSASRTVLTDIGALMALLRSGDAEDHADLHPQAGLARMDELVARFTEVGLHIDLQRESGTPALSPASDHVAYLALQEGLTNAHKHGSGHSVSMKVSTTDGGVLLSVTNQYRSHKAQVLSSGHGLRGLRERVAAVRGTVATRREDGVFSLVVEIPVDQGVER